MTETLVRFKDPWGFTKLDVFRTCKAKFKYQFLDKLPQGSSPAMERGAAIHEDIEAYLNGWSPVLCKEAESWKEPLDALRKHQHKGEQALGIDKDWVLLPDWFDKRTWLRVKMDAHYRDGPMMSVIDFKSGKFREPSTDQVELYAVAGLSIHPDIETVKAEFWFIDTGDVYSRDYTRAELYGLRKKYERESAPMYSEEAWAPFPSRECRWCPYSRTKGGPCKF
jgi:hypothetical protein